MSFFTRCFTKKSSPVESPIEQNLKIDHEKRLYNEHHFSSGMDLPVHPKTIYPSTVLDKELTVGQFGEPQRAQRLVKTLHTARPSLNS
jgi:hypothetical protein